MHIANIKWQIVIEKFSIGKTNELLQTDKHMESIIFNSFDSNKDYRKTLLD